MQVDLPPKFHSYAGNCPLGCMYHSLVRRSNCFFANSGSIMAKGMQWKAVSHAAKNGYSQLSGIERTSSRYKCFQFWFLTPFLPAGGGTDRSQCQHRLKV